MNRLWKYLRIAALLLVLAFPVSAAYSWYIYTTTLNSAPFWLFLLVDAIHTLLPALVLLGISQILKRK